MWPQINRPLCDHYQISEIAMDFKVGFKKSLFAGADIDV